MRKFEVRALRTTKMPVQSLWTTSQESLMSRFRDSPGGRRVTNRVEGGRGRIGLSVRNEMRIAKEEEKSAVIKIHERHIASVVVGQWLGRRGREWRMGIRWTQWGRENWDKQDRFYSSLGIIPGSRRSYIALTLSGLPNYSPPLSLSLPPLSLSLSRDLKNVRSPFL